MNVDSEVEDRGDDFIPTGPDATEESKVEQAKEDAKVVARDEKGRFVSGKDDETAQTETETETEVDETKTKTKTAETETEAETEAEAETETEAEAETEAEEEEEETAEQKIPYKRFKQLVDKSNRLQAEIDALKTAKTEVTSTSAEAEYAAQLKAFNDKLSGLYLKVEKLRADADYEQAAATQKEIDQMNRQLHRAENTQIARREAVAAQENTTYDRMLDYLETARPIMNPRSPEFNRDVVVELQELTDMYIDSKRYSPTAALRKAAMMLFAEDPFSPTRDADTAVAKDKDKDKDKPPAKKVEDKKTNIEKNLAAQKKTPPADVGRGSDTSQGSMKVDINKLTDSEFDALPESKKAQMRGDMV